MNNDLISREALKAKMFDIPKPKEGATFWDGVDTVGNLIDNAPTVEERRNDILGAKISCYDPKKIRGGSDPNPTESKNIEYATISQKIEEKTKLLASENVRTLEVIEKVEDAKIRGMLISRYLNRKSWVQIGKDYHYEKSRSNDYRHMSLKAVYEFIPKEVIV